MPVITEIADLKRIYQSVTEDEALLARYAGSYDFRIKTAARAAARRLTTRLKQLPN